MSEFEEPVIFELRDVLVNNKKSIDFKIATEERQIEYFNQLSQRLSDDQKGLLYHIFAYDDDFMFQLSMKYSVDEVLSILDELQEMNFVQVFERLAVYKNEVHHVDIVLLQNVLANNMTSRTSPEYFNQLFQKLSDDQKIILYWVFRYDSASVFYLTRRYSVDDVLSILNEFLKMNFVQVCQRLDLYQDDLYHSKDLKD